jgi:hypothetical protein
MSYVNVLPKNEDIARVVRHPSGVRFRSLIDPVAWPSDQFTFRRIKDGDVTVVSEVQAVAAPKQIKHVGPGMRPH